VLSRYARQEQGNYQEVWLRRQERSDLQLRPNKRQTLEMNRRIARGMLFKDQQAKDIFERVAIDPGDRLDS